MLNRVREKIRVYENLVWGCERGVVRKEERGWLLWDLADYVVAVLLLCLLQECGFFLILLEAGIALTDHAFGLGEFAGLLCFAHRDGVRGGGASGYQD